MEATQTRTVGTIVSRYSGKKVARVLTPDDRTGAEAALKSAWDSSMALNGAVVELIYGECECIYISSADCTFEDCRRRHMPTLQKEYTRLCEERATAFCSGNRPVA